MTVKELKEYCEEQIEKGNGDKHIYISDDEEGNGYHSLYYDFTTYEEEPDLIDEIADEYTYGKHTYDTIIVLG